MNITDQLAELKKNKADFLNQTVGWDRDKLSYSKDENSWNALKIIEHVMVSEYGTLSYLKKKTQNSAHEIPQSTDENENHSNQLIEALISDKKWKAPEVLPEPKGDKSRDELINFWDGTTERLEAFVLELPTEYHQRQIFKHPYAGRLNLEQTLDFLSKHIVHHQKQIERLFEE